MTDIEKAEYDDVIRQLTTRLRETVDENDRLRAELARQAEDTSAYDVLVDIMRNSDLPAAIRTKAASAVLPHQMPKLMPERAPLELNPVPSEPLADTLHRQRADESDAGIAA
jgi:hypothetical protein